MGRFTPASGQQRMPARIALASFADSVIFLPGWEEVLPGSSYGRGLVRYWVIRGPKSVAEVNGSTWPPG
jgi:hypothetical protein